MTVPLLQVEHLHKVRDRVAVVDDVSFALDGGEIMELAGANGAGKTTVLSIVCGVIIPDDGRIAVRGQWTRPGHRSLRHAIGYVPQDIALWDSFSCVENLRFFGRLHGLRGRTLDDGVKRAVSVCGLEDFATKPVKRLSGGMKRRANLAAAMVHAPEILVLDEPTVGIDALTRRLIIDQIATIARAGTAVLIASHQGDGLERIVTRRVTLCAGRVTAREEGLLADTRSAASTSAVAAGLTEGSNGVAPPHPSRRRGFGRRSAS